MQQCRAVVDSSSTATQQTAEQRTAACARQFRRSHFSRVCDSELPRTFHRHVVVGVEDGIGGRSRGIGMMTGGVTPVHHHHPPRQDFNGGSQNGRRALVTGGVTPVHHHHHHTTLSTTLTWTRREHGHCDNMDHLDFLGSRMVEAVGRRAVLPIILNGIRRKAKASARKRLPSPTQSSVSTCHST